jgi:hypothetical protein
MSKQNVWRQLTLTGIDDNIADQGGFMTRYYAKGVKSQDIILLTSEPDELTRNS